MNIPDGMVPPGRYIVWARGKRGGAVGNTRLHIPNNPESQVALCGNEASFYHRWVEVDRAGIMVAPAEYVGVDAWEEGFRPCTTCLKAKLSPKNGG